MVVVVVRITFVWSDGGTVVYIKSGTVIFFFFSIFFYLGVTVAVGACLFVCLCTFRRKERCMIGVMAARRVGVF